MTLTFLHVEHCLKYFLHFLFTITSNPLNDVFRDIGGPKKKRQNHNSNMSL